MAFYLSVGRGGLYVRSLWTVYLQGQSQTLAALMCLFEELHMVQCGKERKMATTISWHLLWQLAGHQCPLRLKLEFESWKEN